MHADNGKGEGEPDSGESSAHVRPAGVAWPWRRRRRPRPPVDVRRSDKSIRGRLTSTVLIPSVTMLALWFVVASLFLYNGFYTRAVASSVREVSIPAVTALAALQEERKLVLQYLDNPALAPSELSDQQAETDEKIGVLGAAFDATIANAPDEIASQVTALRSQFERLPVLRVQISLRSIDQAQVSAYYDGVLDAASNLFDTQARVVPDPEAALGGVTATSVFRSAEMMSRSSSLVAAAFETGGFTPDAFVRFTQQSGFYRTQLSQIAPFLDPEVRVDFETLTASAPWQELAAAEGALLRYGPWSGPEPADVPVAEADWQNLTDEVGRALNNIAVEQADEVSAAALASGNAQFLRAIIGSIVALIASLAAIFVAVRVSRSLVDRTLMTRLHRLRDDVLDRAHKRLPDIVARLKNGQQVDLHDELPKLKYGKDEIGEVAEAFNAAQEAAVSAAVSEAKARSGLETVFLGIALRNQTLIQQQLRLIDELERGEQDSALLGALYRLDHLATRQRRTNDNLIILGGGQAGRRYRDPVPLFDVLRGTVSETEHYARVRLEQAPDVALVGSVVTDVAHMIAELVDNATTFSHDSPVELTSRIVARGVAVEVSDQGLGMKDHDRQQANQMMATAPKFDAMALRADTALGLFVVANLSAKLGTTVTFDESRHGGLRATVLIPTRHVVARRDVTQVDITGSALRETPAILQMPAPSPRPQPHPAPSPRPRPQAAQALTVSDSVPDIAHPGPEPTRTAGVVVSPLERRDDRPPLPQRLPQQYLVAELREPPDEAPREVAAGDKAAQSLTAFHTGGRRGREGADEL